MPRKNTLRSKELQQKNDSIAIIVSEQTGRISYCRNGELSLDIKASELKTLLTEDFSAKTKTEAKFC